MIFVNMHSLSRGPTDRRGAYWATSSLLKKNPPISAIVTVHNTQAVGAKALVGVETPPRQSTGAPLDRYNEPSNANCRQRKLQMSGNYEHLKSEILVFLCRNFYHKGHTPALVRLKPHGDREVHEGELRFSFVFLTCTPWRRPPGQVCARCKCRDLCG